MKCLSDIEIKDYIGGKLTPQQMLEASLHLGACSGCRCRVQAMPDYRSSILHLQEQIIAPSCPEYEVLSAYVDGSLEKDQAGLIKSHVLVCECCSRDVDTMESLRSRAALAPTVTFGPGMVRRPSIWKLWLPKYAPAAGAVAAAAVVLAIVLGGPSSQPGSGKHPSVVAVEPGSVPTDLPETHAPNNVVKPGPAISAPDKLTSQPVNPVAPVVTPTSRPEVVATVTRDYSRLGSASDIERVKQAVEEKLRTGKLSADQPIRVAMNMAGDRVRAGSDSSSGPRLISPVSKTLLRGSIALKWNAVDGADAYRVEVTDVEGREVLTKEVTSTSLNVPASVIPSGNQTLLWRVSAKLGSDLWESGKAAAIHVLSADDTQMIKRAASAYAGDHLLLGTVYEMNGLYAQAEAQYEALAALPNHPANTPKMLSSVRAKLEK